MNNDEARFVGLKMPTSALGKGRKEGKKEGSKNAFAQGRVIHIFSITLSLKHISPEKPVSNHN
jgi:hypothetical protein